MMMIFIRPRQPPQGHFGGPCQRGSVRMIQQQQFEQGLFDGSIRHGRVFANFEFGKRVIVPQGLHQSGGTGIVHVRVALQIERLQAGIVSQGGRQGVDAGTGDPILGQAQVFEGTSVVS